MTKPKERGPMQQPEHVATCDSCDKPAVVRIEEADPAVVRRWTYELSSGYEQEVWAGDDELDGPAGGIPDVWYCWECLKEESPEKAKAFNEYCRRHGTTPEEVQANTPEE